MSVSCTWVLSSVMATSLVCAADASPKWNVQVLEFCLGLNAAFLSLNQLPREHCITTKNLISTLCCMYVCVGGGGTLFYLGLVLHLLIIVPCATLGAWGTAVLQSQTALASPAQWPLAAEEQEVKSVLFFF